VDGAGVSVNDKSGGRDGGSSSSNNNNFSPPSTYADLVRPFEDFVRAVLDLTPLLQQKDQDETDKKEEKNTENEAYVADSSSSDENLLSFLRFLPPGLKWFVGPVTPSLPPSTKDDSSRNHRRSKHMKENHDRRSKSKSKVSPPPSQHSTHRKEKLTPRRLLRALSQTLTNLIDPSLRNPTAEGGSFTTVVDKVLTSTPRLLAIANLLLAVTYLLHGAVAEWFLGGGGTGSVGRGLGRGGSRANLVARAANRNNDLAGGDGGGTPTAAAAARNQGAATAPPAALPNTRLTRSTRERLGGYLLFKLLLVSAVVEPDTLDLLILLSWYTLLSFLRSLAHLAGSATSHAAQSGSPPVPGVLRLLVAVLVSDFCAAAVCAALFHGAGWGTVLLLACDCALLAVDVLAHLARHVGQVLEDKHSAEVGTLEDEQLRLGEETRNSTSSMPTVPVLLRSERGEDNVEREQTQGQLRDRAHQESRRIDRQIELLESQHSRRLSILDAAVFGLELTAYLLTICHFLHIWSLHGVSFGLVDGVLALHLHSAVSAMGRKIAERRNLNRIARDLDSQFADATETELLKSAQAGDVCSVCLGTMSGLRNVKKVGCGHLFHTHCLREVVERARSIEAARCPLCRASVVDGSQPGARRGQTEANGPQEQGGGQQEQQPDGQQGTPQQARQGPAGGDQALFSFSTETILPNWIPLPALSFEIVRRPPTNINATAAARRDRRAAPQAVGANNGPQQQNQQQRQQGEMPFWRRLLILSGAIPMSAEEEQTALEQLVDMFPQYDRADLLRELRARGSAEGVVEAVLAGVFSGTARGVGAGGALIAERQPGENVVLPQEENANNLLEDDENSILDTESADNDDNDVGSVENH